MRNGFSFIELVMVVLVIGILATLSLPKLQKRFELDLLRMEKNFLDRLWLDLEQNAEYELEFNGTDKWPYNPLTVSERVRGYTVTLQEGLPIKDNEWTFYNHQTIGPAVFFRRMNNEIVYYPYDSTDFYLGDSAYKL